MNIRMGFLLLIAASVLPRMAVAQSAGESSKAPAAEAALPAATTSAQEEAHAAAPAPKPVPAEEGATFVDRDGDGIQDGQEHRFRKHGKGHLGKGTGGMDTGTGAMRRFRGGSGGNGPGQGGGR